MPLFKIKKSENTGALLASAWHPNFRNFERLPDVKAVRTSFFVNCVAIVIVLAALIYFGLQEYKLHEVQAGSQGIAYWQNQIDSNQKASEEAIYHYQKFQNEEKKVAQVAAFLKSDFVLSDFIIELGQTLPEHIALNSIDVQDNGVALSGTVRGTSDEASGQTEAYIDQLRAYPQIAQRFEKISLTGLDRGGNAGQLDFKIFMKSKKGMKP